MAFRSARQRTFPLLPRRGETGWYLLRNRGPAFFICFISSVVLMTPLWILWVIQIIWSFADDLPVVDYDIESFRSLYNHSVTFSLDQIRVQVLKRESNSVWTVPEPEEDFHKETMNSIAELQRSDPLSCQVFCRFPQPTFELEHFPHFLQQAYPCWSILSALRDCHKRYIILPAHLSKKLKYIQAVIRSMEEVGQVPIHFLYANESLPVENCGTNEYISIQPPNTTKGSCSAFLVEKMFSDSGWDRPARYFFIGDDSFGHGVKDWQFAVLGKVMYQNSLASNSKKKRMNVLILDRKGSTRAFLHAAKIKRLLQAESRNITCIESKVKYIASFSGYTLGEQARAIHDADIIFSPHGAQLSNLIYIRPCTVVVEFFPRSYYLQFFQSLVVVARGLSYEAYPYGADKVADTKIMLQSKDPDAKGQARSGTIDANPESVAVAFPKLVQAALKCRENLEDS